MTDSPSNHCFQVPLARAGVPNRRLRVYSRSVLARVVEQWAAGAVILGTVGMPDLVDPLIETSRLSHRITALWWDGDLLMATVEVFPGPAGEALLALMEHGPMAFRLDGAGSVVTSHGVEIVQDDYVVFGVHAVPAQEGA